MVYIYVLQLVNNKYYIGKTNNPKFRLDNHFESNGCTWTRKFKPINIERLIPDCCDFDEDKYTLMYMSMKGIDNTRGGSFCQVELTDDLKRFILRMLYSSSNLCFLCGSGDHFVNNCPSKLDISPSPSPIPSPSNSSSNTISETYELPKENRKIDLSVKGLYNDEQIIIRISKRPIKTLLC